MIWQLGSVCDVVEFSKVMLYVREGVSEYSCAGWVMRCLSMVVEILRRSVFMSDTC